MMFSLGTTKSEMMIEGHSAHLAYHVYKSGRKTSIIISLLVVPRLNII
jgi:hypothetical protein